MTRQSGQTCTSPIPPNKRPVDNTLQLDGELCLTLSVGKANVMIFIEELACSKICVLRVPLILTCTQKTNKEIVTDFHTNALLEVTTSCRRLSRRWKQSPPFWTGVQPTTDGMTPYGISKEKWIEEYHVSWKRHIYRLWDEKYIILVNFLAVGQRWISSFMLKR
jgi:hypothetical protein